MANAAAGTDARVVALGPIFRPGTRGIEIGPFRRPMAPKRAGHDTLVVDWLDREALVAKARGDGDSEAALAAIEEVDVVGDASRLLDLVRGAGVAGTFDWIASSHTFEHIPDPVRFLRDCRALLSPGGAVAMVMPDKRFCFDRFQPTATLAGMVEAWERGGGDDAWLSFHQQSCKAYLDCAGRQAMLWPAASDDPRQLRCRDPRPPYAKLRAALADPVRAPFRGHRWWFTPGSFAALLHDLRLVGLIELEVERVTAMATGEFATVLRVAGPIDPDIVQAEAHRATLYAAAEDDAAVVSAAYRRLSAELAEARAELAALRPQPAPGSVVPPPGTSEG